jgi:hypothetical protein
MQVKHNNRYTSRISIFQQYLHTLFVFNRLELVHEVSNPEVSKIISINIKLLNSPVSTLPPGYFVIGFIFRSYQKLS